MCVCVCGWVSSAPVSDSVVSLSRCQDGKITVSGRFTYISWDFSIERQAFALAALLAKNTNSRPGVCSALCVWDHFRLLDVLLCCCASETMWPCIFHTLFSYQRFNSFAQTPPDGIEDLISGIIVHVRRKIQTVFLFVCFLKMKWVFSCFRLPVFLLLLLVWLFKITHCFPPRS